MFQENLNDAIAFCKVFLRSGGIYSAGVVHDSRSHTVPRRQFLVN